MDNKYRLLAIDDIECNLKYLVKDLEASGYYTAHTDNNKTANNILKNGNNFDITIISYILPQFEGIGVLNIIINNDLSIEQAIIIPPAPDSLEQLQKGPDAGVFYYFRKPYKPNMLLDIFQNIIEKRNVTTNNYNSIGFGKFTFRTFNDISIISHFISKFCSKPDEALVGIFELMVNAIEHGNLGIDFFEKTKLLLSNSWAEEIDKRLMNESYLGKEANLSFEKKDNLIEITIEDMGEGFDPQQFMELNFDQPNLPNGRGIAIARLTSFHSIEYIGSGNKVICKIQSK